MIRDIESPSFARDVARRIRRGRRALVVKSMKSPGGDLRVESALERDVGILLDIDPRVRSLTAQPFTLELQSNQLLPSRDQFCARPGAKPRFYTPDFLCSLGDGSAVAVDAKHTRFLEAFEPRSAEISACLRQHGISFLLVPDTAVSPTTMATVAELHLLRAGYLDGYRAQTEDVLADLLSEQACWPVDELIAFPAVGKVGVLCGLLAGILKTDLSVPVFCAGTKVSAAFGDLSHLQVLEMCA